MQIRKATIEDIEYIAKLYMEQFCAMKDLMPDIWQEGQQSKDFIRTTIQGEDSDILVLDHDGVIVGFTLLQEKETPNFPFFVKHRYAYLMDIITTKNARQKGYGSALMEAAKKWATDRKLDYIELDVLSNNEKAMSLYKKFGFTDKRKNMICKL